MVAIPSSIGVVPLPFTVLNRLASLERAALEFEGALFSHRDLLARLLAKLPDGEARKAIHDLIADGEAQADKLGAPRLAGYCDELNAVHDEMGHSKAETAGIFARLSRLR